MSMHTTSPWIVESGKKFSGDNWLVCSVGRSNEDDLEYFVTTDHVRCSELSGDAKYDASLIAAAPELLEALQSCLGIIEMECDACTGCEDSTCTVCRAKAAIRKAGQANEGGTR